MNIFVEELSRGTIGAGGSNKGMVKIEDNVGESIHIHYDNFRIEMSIDDFDTLATKFVEAGEELDGNR